jgi:hypothetical protein
MLVHRAPGMHAAGTMPIAGQRPGARAQQDLSAAKGRAVPNDGQAVALELPGGQRSGKASVVTGRVALHVSVRVRAVLIARVNSSAVQVTARGADLNMEQGPRVRGAAVALQIAIRVAERYGRTAGAVGFVKVVGQTPAVTLYESRTPGRRTADVVAIQRVPPVVSRAAVLLSVATVGQGAVHANLINGMTGQEPAGIVDQGHAARRDTPDPAVASRFEKAPRLIPGVQGIRISRSGHQRGQFGMSAGMRRALKRIVRRGHQVEARNSRISRPSKRSAYRSAPPSG